MVIGTSSSERCNAVGSFAERLVKDAEAEDLFSGALATFEKSALSESTRTAELLNFLALAYMRRRKYSEAEPLLERSLEILTKVPVPPKVMLQATIHGLKMTYRILKKRDKAESLDRRFSRLLKSLNQSGKGSHYWGTRSRPISSLNLGS